MARTRNVSAGPGEWLPFRKRITFHRRGRAVSVCRGGMGVIVDAKRAGKCGGTRGDRVGFHQGFRGTIFHARDCAIKSSQNCAQYRFVKESLDSMTDSGANSATHFIAARRDRAANTFWKARAFFQRSADRCVEKGGMPGQTWAGGCTLVSCLS